MELQDPRPADLISEEPVTGDLMICGGCGNINSVTPLGTRILTDKEFSELSRDEQKDISFAIRAVRMKVREN